jgi:hypothetical protein
MADLVVRLFISVDTVLLAEDKASIRAMKLVWERASLDCVAPLLATRRMLTRPSLTRLQA